MKEQVFAFKKEGDKISVWRKDDMKKVVASLEDGKYEWVLRRLKKKRSNLQSGYYFGCVIPAVYDGLIDLGYERKDLDLNTVHEFLKAKFLKKNVVNEEGEFITVPISTSSLSTVEFMMYIAEIQQWSAEFLKIIIVDPETQTNLDIK